MFFSIQHFAKVFFSHNYALFSELYSQRKDILKKDLIFPSASKRHVPDVACTASIFHWVIVRKFDWKLKMEEGGWEGKKTKLSFLPSPTPFPFIPSFCSGLTFSTQAMLDGELDRDRFKGSELKPGQSNILFPWISVATGYIFSVEHTTCDYRSQTNKNSKT